MEKKPHGNRVNCQKNACFNFAYIRKLASIKTFK